MREKFHNIQKQGKRRHIPVPVAGTAGQSLSCLRFPSLARLSCTMDGNQTMPHHLNRIIRQDATALAREAGEIALRHYGTVREELKDNRSVVTAADREIETYLQERLPPLIPGSLFVGEEMAKDALTVSAAQSAPWVWVVDPIDGTAGFLDGLDLFCIAIGLLQEGHPAGGVLYFPATRHLYLAVPGEGAEYDGEPIKVRDIEPHPDRRVLCVEAYAHRRLRIDYPGKTRSLSSTALHLALVARGAAVGAISSGYVWDYAAAAAILEAAGGRLAHRDGTAIDWRQALDGRRLGPILVGAPGLLWQKVANAVSLRE